MEQSRDIETLIELMARLPGLGPRSARRAVLALLKKRGALMAPLAQAMATVALTAKDCVICGNIGTAEVCPICSDDARANGEICVVEDVSDLWAMERGGAFKGRYHVLGGTLSALDAIGPEELGIPRLVDRAPRCDRSDSGAERHRGWPDHRALHRRCAGGTGRANHLAGAGRADWWRVELS